MKKICCYTLWFGLAISSFGVATATAQTFYSVSRDDALLRQLDPATGTTISSTMMTLAGQSINGATGLAKHPASLKLFAILKLQGVSGRELVTIDPLTGVVTSIGNTGAKFAGLAFSCDRTLFGITGDGANVPETLFTISTLNASTSLALTLGAGDDGETIAFHPGDGLLYHVSGRTPGSSEIFESIDLNTLAVTNIPLSGDAYFEATALAYDPLSNELLLADLANNLYTITRGGVATMIGGVGRHPKGLAYSGSSGCVQQPVVAIPSLGYAGRLVLLLLLCSAGMLATLRRVN